MAGESITCLISVIGFFSFLAPQCIGWVKVLGIIGMHGLLIVLALIMRMKPRILLVEDDRVNTIIFHHYFQKEFEIVHLLSGYELFEELAKSPIDVVILDINLGKVDINVVKLVSVIREHPAYNEIIVFALTGYATHGDEALFLSKGFNK